MDTIPTFWPTEEEFSDFSAYVTAVEAHCKSAPGSPGLAKIVPPASWLSRYATVTTFMKEQIGSPSSASSASSSALLPNGLEEMVIPSPIRQYVTGRQGVFQILNVMEKERTVAQFMADARLQEDKCLHASQRKSRQEKEEEERREKKRKAAMSRERQNGGQQQKEEAIADKEDAEKEEEKEKGGKKAGAAAETDMKQLFRERKFDWEELERKFWKNVTFHPPLYGADMLGSLFEEEEDEKGEEEQQNRKTNRNAWNLANLDSLLLRRIGKELPGVTKPYLYFGMWKAMFGCHTEDMELFSINYLHFGQPKFWYGVSPTQRERFEGFAQQHYPHQYKECSQFLRHKSSMLSPTLLRASNIPVVKGIQEAGHFIITFPGAFHFGFNTGFNCAESVNFALPSWIEHGLRAKPCTCISDSVTIDVRLFVNGEQQDDAASCASSALAEAKEKVETKNERRSKSSRTRKRGSNASGTKRKIVDERESLTNNGESSPLALTKRRGGRAGAGTAMANTHSHHQRLPRRSRSNEGVHNGDAKGIALQPQKQTRVRPPRRGKKQQPQHLQLQLQQQWEEEAPARSKRRAPTSKKKINKIERTELVSYFQEENETGTENHWFVEIAAEELEGGAGGDESWKFSCICGEISQSDDPPDLHPKGRMFECSECRLWGHIDCYDDYKGYRQEELPESMTCHLCRINNSSNRSLQRNKKRKKQEHSNKSESPSLYYYLHHQNTPPGGVYLSASNEEEEERKKKEKKEKHTELLCEAWFLDDMNKQKEQQRKEQEEREREQEREREREQERAREWEREQERELERERERQREQERRAKERAEEEEERDRQRRAQMLAQLEEVIAQVEHGGFNLDIVEGESWNVAALMTANHLQQQQNHDSLSTTEPTITKESVQLPESAPARTKRKKANSSSLHGNNIKTQDSGKSKKRGYNSSKKDKKRKRRKEKKEKKDKKSKTKHRKKNKQKEQMTTRHQRAKEKQNRTDSQRDNKVEDKKSVASPKHTESQPNRFIAHSFHHHHRPTHITSPSQDTSNNIIHQSLPPLQQALPPLASALSFASDFAPSPTVHTAPLHNIASTASSSSSTLSPTPNESPSSSSAFFSSSSCGPPSTNSTIPPTALNGHYSIFDVKKTVMPSSSVAANSLQSSMNSSSAYPPIFISSAAPSSSSFQPSPASSFPSASYSTLSVSSPSPSSSSLSTPFSFPTSSTNELSSLVPLPSISAAPLKAKPSLVSHDSHRILSTNNNSEEPHTSSPSCSPSQSQPQPQLSPQQPQPQSMMYHFPVQSKPQQSSQPLSQTQTSSLPSLILPVTTNNVDNNNAASAQLLQRLYLQQLQLRLLQHQQALHIQNQLLPPLSPSQQLLLQLQQQALPLSSQPAATQQNKQTGSTASTSGEVASASSASTTTSNANATTSSSHLPSSSSFYPQLAPKPLLPKLLPQPSPTPIAPFPPSTSLFPFCAPTATTPSQLAALYLLSAAVASNSTNPTHAAALHTLLQLAPLQQLQPPASLLSTSSVAPQQTLQQQQAQPSAPGGSSAAAAASTQAQ
ncbi:Lysine (K)-specific demethylase 4A [Balamuthia mandrillaris]